MGVNFDASRSEVDLMVKIAERFERLVPAHARQKRLDLLMDLEACHCNGAPLDLVALHEAASDGDLVHDVAGISRHIDRDTGKLGGCFLPRYAARASARAAA